MPIFAPSLPNLAHLEEEAGGRIAIGTIALLDDWPRMSKFGSSEKAKLCVPPLAASRLIA